MGLCGAMMWRSRSIIFLSNVPISVSPSYLLPPPCSCVSKKALKLVFWLPGNLLVPLIWYTAQYSLKHSLLSNEFLHIGG